VLQEISSTEKLKFLDEIETVKEEAENLKGQGVDIIIALSHAGLDVDREVAAAVPDIDVIVGGHSHSFLYTGKQRIG
jgi:5''-nucleotidase/2'',3''-cyclic phosphodiesterase and related esterases